MSEEVLLNTKTNKKNRRKDNVKSAAKQTKKIIKDDAEHDERKNKKIKYVKKEGKELNIKKKSTNRKDKKAKDEKIEGIVIQESNNCEKKENYIVEQEYIIDSVEKIGQTLKSKREYLNLSTNHVASRLNVRPRYIEYIEKNDFDSLEKEMVYINGLVKSYIRVLGIDPEAEKIIRGLLKDFKKEESLKSLNVKPDIKPSNRAIKYSIFVLVLVYLMFIVWSKVEKKELEFNFQQMETKDGFRKNF
jgi:transcriptional regulator with XRE-family HTH domain